MIRRCRLPVRAFGYLQSPPLECAADV